VKNVVPKSTYNIPLPPNWGPPVTQVSEVPRNSKVDYGAYLTGPLGHCIECHTPFENGMPDYENQLAAGGFAFHGPWGVSVSANITPDVKTGIGAWTDEEIKTAITTGVRRDGERLKPPMGFYYYKNISDDDLDAIVAWLRSIPPKRNQLR
jgi:mono/diheme cytochrome c family protein